MNSIDIILFDLGGVLYEMTGVSTMLQWTNTKLSESETETPRYCPIKSVDLLIGWASSSSVNSREL